jgi:hypothetical protein
VYQKTLTVDNLFEPGETITETHYFHLMSARIVEMELQAQADSGDPEIGLAQHIQSITGSGSGAQIMNLFKQLLRAAYGERDGNKFKQNELLSYEFINSQFFDRLLTIFLTDPNEASVFVNGIMPRELMEAAGGNLAPSSAAAPKTVQTVALPSSAILVADLDPEKFGAMFEQSGLENPLTDDATAFVPWWNREPTPKELQTMGPVRMKAAFARKASGWTPPSA